MKWREGLVIAVAVTVCPSAAWSQPLDQPTIGFLSSVGRNDRPNLVEGFRRGLREAGYVEGYNVAVQYRFAENQYDRLPGLASDLVGHGVKVLVATGGGQSIAATKAVNTNIPIVFTYGGDPVRNGFVASLNRPGGNITGISFFASAVAAKGLGVLHEIVPGARLVAMLTNSQNSESVDALHEAQKAAQRLGLQDLVLDVSTPEAIDAGFVTLQQRGAGALMVIGDPFLTARRQQIVALAARLAIPAIYFNRDFVADGGLLSYSNDVPDVYRHAAHYAARILKGEKPADLPVEQPTKFELLINLKTVKALGLNVPSGILAAADDVIE